MSPILNKKRIGLFYCILIVSFFVISILRSYEVEAFPGFERYGNDSVRIEQYSPASHPVVSYPPQRIVYPWSSWLERYGNDSVRIEQYPPASHPVVSYPPRRIVYPVRNFAFQHRILYISNRVDPGGSWFVRFNCGNAEGPVSFKDLIIDLNRRTVRIESGDDEREEDENDLREADSEDTKEYVLLNKEDKEDSVSKEDKEDSEE